MKTGADEHGSQKVREKRTSRHVHSEPIVIAGRQMNSLNLASSNFQRTRRNVHLIQHEDVIMAACAVLEIREFVRSSIMVLKAMLEKKGIFRCCLCLVELCLSHRPFCCQALITWKHADFVNQNGSRIGRS